MKKFTCLVLFFVLMCTGTGWSHSLWVNLYESFAHPPGHALVALGWGHSVPLDDFLGSEAGSIHIEKYQLIDPSNKISSLGLPEIKKEAETKTESGMITESGDLGLRKISLTEKTQKGTYQVTAESKATYFTGYLDKKGKMKMTTKPMDKIKDAKEIKFSTRYKAVGKAYMTIGEWTTPEDPGFDLEITPVSKMNNLKKGDLVKFEVKLNGQKLTCDMKGMNFLFASSNTFGGPDKFELCSKIMNGKAQVRIPTSGEWCFSVLVKKNVTKDNELKDLYGKCNSIFYGSTLTAVVKP